MAVCFFGGRNLMGCTPCKRRRNVPTRTVLTFLSIQKAQSRLQINFSYSIAGMDIWALQNCARSLDGQKEREVTHTAMNAQ